MHLRRTTGLALGALLLAAPALTACGFNYATDRPNTISAGANAQDGSVDVLNAMIVSGQDDSGTFIASFSNNNQAEEAGVDSLAGGEGNTLQPATFTPVVIAPGDLVSLADEGGIVVSGSFGAGDFVPVTVGLANGESVTLDVPVVPDSGEFEGLDISAAAGEAVSSGGVAQSKGGTRGGRGTSQGTGGGKAGAAPSGSPSATPTE